MKAKIKLRFKEWQRDGEPVPLEMAGNDNEESTGSPPILGAVDSTVDRLYELIKAQTEQGRKGVFVLEVVD